MNEVYVWVATALVAAVGVSTISRLWTDRSRLWRDELQDEDRFFALRIVLFLIYPALVAIDLRATIVATQLFGGSVKEFSYGLFWYSAYPQYVPAGDAYLIVLFAGVAVQLFLAISLLPSLIFRPHPFLATIIGYTVATTLAVNLIAEPFFGLMGLGGTRWHIVLTSLPVAQKLAVFGVYFALASAFLAVISNEKTRLWFADLSRPVIAEKLRDALMQYRIEPASSLVLARLALFYERAGLNGQAKRHLRLLQAYDSDSLYTVLTYAVLKYRDRKYKASREAFILASDFSNIDVGLKAVLLAAAACAAFAQGDMEGALNLSERSLEFDDASLVARMVKVDVYLRTGKKEQAGDEIISAMRRGLDMDLESKIPLDAERALVRINRLQTTAAKRVEQKVS